MISVSVTLLCLLALQLLTRVDPEFAGPDATEMQLMVKRVGGEAVNGDGISLHSHNADNVRVKDSVGKYVAGIAQGEIGSVCLAESEREVTV